MNKYQIFFILSSIEIITEIPLIALIPILLIIFELGNFPLLISPKFFKMVEPTLYCDKRQINISVLDLEIQLIGLSKQQMLFALVLLSIAIAITIPLIAVLPLLL